MAGEEVISEGGKMLCYETAKAVTTHPAIVVWIIITVAVPLILYFIAGITIKGRSPSGNVSSKVMGASLNYYWAIIIWGLIQTSFIVLLIFPVWLKIFC